jgi:hypothetical protein
MMASALAVFVIPNEVRNPYITHALSERQGFLTLFGMTHKVGLTHFSTLP